MISLQLKQAFANTEDTFTAKTPEEKKKMLRVNDDVERVRRSNITYTCVKCFKNNQIWVYCMKISFALCL